MVSSATRMGVRRQEHATFIRDDAQTAHGRDPYMDAIIDVLDQIHGVYCLQFYLHSPRSSIYCRPLYITSIASSKAFVRRCERIGTRSCARPPPTCARCKPKGASPPCVSILLVATARLVPCSVDHFNALVDLEAEYAAAGRNMVRGTEDWVVLNRAVCQDIALAVEAHDRTMLTKRMPTVLVPL